MGGKMTFPGGGIYHGTKHAVEAISDALRFEVRGFGVDVIVIEPGLIRTQFGEAAVNSIESGTTGNGPYAEFNAAVAATTAGAYDGPLAKLGGGPETVARKIEKAISRRRPRTRYPVTPSARMIMGDPHRAARPRLGRVQREQLPAAEAVTRCRPSAASRRSSSGAARTRRRAIRRRPRAAS